MSPEGQARNAGAIRMQQAQCHRANGNGNSIVFQHTPTPQKSTPTEKTLDDHPTIDYGAASERTLFSGKGPAHKERSLYGRRTQKTT
jgi:hypothetical protein